MLTGPQPHQLPKQASATLIGRAGLVLGVLGALVLVAPVFGAGPPAGEDVMAHLVRADHAIPHLVNHGRLDGWFPRFVLGHQEFLFNGPGLTWLMALLRGLTLGAMSNTAALKIVVIGSFAAVPPAVWFLARSFGLGRRGAGLAAIGALVVSGPYGPGLEGTFAIGLISHQVGAVLFLVSFGAVLRLLGDPSRRWVALAAAALAGLAVTHLISVLILALMLALVLAGLAVGGRLPWSGIRRLVVTVSVAAGLGGFWLVPALAHRDLRGYVTTWATPPLLERLVDVGRGDVLLPAGLLLAVVGAGVWCVARRPAMATCACLPAAYLVVAHGAPHVIGLNDGTLQLANRGLGYAGLVALLPLAALAAEGSQRLRIRAEVGLLVAATALAVAVAPGRNEAGQMPEPVPAMGRAAAALTRLVPDGARFATQRDYPAEIRRTGVIHPEIWLARVSGRNSLNGFNLESSSTPEASLEANRLGKRPAAASARALARLGVSHVVTTTTHLARDLDASASFDLQWRQAPLSIFSVATRDGNPEPGSLLSALDPFAGRLVRAGAERLDFEVTAERPVAVTVAVAWSPKWSGRLVDGGGRPGGQVRVDHTSDGLIRLDLPVGTTRFALQFRADGWDRLGVTLTLLTLAGLAASAVRDRTRFRSHRGTTVVPG